MLYKQWNYSAVFDGMTKCHWSLLDIILCELSDGTSTRCNKHDEAFGVKLLIQVV